MQLDYDFMMQSFALILKGIPVTMEITIGALVIAMPIAFILAILRINNVPILKQLIVLNVSFVRGTPIVLQILLMYTLLPSLLNSFVKNMGWNYNVFDSVDPFYYALIVFSLNTIAVLSEVFRSALLSIPKLQMEAGLTAGLSAVQTYFHIILPQALVVALPSIGNIAVNLVKGSSLAFLMTVKDVMALAKIEASFGYNYVESYLNVFFVYIIICTIVQYLFHYLERYYSRFRRTA